MTWQLLSLYVLRPNKMIIDIAVNEYQDTKQQPDKSWPGINTSKSEKKFGKIKQPIPSLITTKKHESYKWQLANNLNTYIS